jgi:hypothetical protein
MLLDKHSATINSMNFEKISGTTHRESLTAKFRSLRNEEASMDSHEEIPLAELESLLNDSGLTLANTSDVIHTFNDNSLLCRSESFSKVIDLLYGTPLNIENPDNHANMCTMAGGSGFRTAMQEGFSGKDVNGTVKVVITFTGDHLDDQSSIPMNDDLWQTKPNTAQVSLRGEGTVTLADITMISFRFPVQYVPEAILTEDERELFEDDKLQFIVRHYCRESNTATH